MSRPEQLDYQLYSDHVHAVHVPHRARPLSRHPATVVEADKQRTWYECLEATVRYELNRLDCERKVNVEGVVIQRTEAHNRVQYRVNGSKKRYSYAETVALVVALSNREGDCKP